MQARHHYEQAFEHYLRLRRLPYVSVNEARKALLPQGPGVGGEGAELEALKSFDFVLYGPELNLLVEIKGRKIGRRASRAKGTRAGGKGGGSAGGGGVQSLLPLAPAILPDPPRPPATRLENWVTEDDIASLTAWEGLFGEGFRAAFVFIYWCEQQPPAPLFEELFEFRGRWYAVRAILLRDYRAAMKPRSPRWRTVHMPIAAFDRACRPIAEAERPGQAAAADRKGVPTAGEVRTMGGRRLVVAPGDGAERIV